MKIIQSSDYALISPPSDTVFAGHKLKFKGSRCLLYMHLDDCEQAHVGPRTCFQRRCQISSPVRTPLLPLLSLLWWRKKSHICPLTLIS